MSEFSTMTSESLPRPPSVPENVWDAVPVGLRREFIERAAMALRTGIHPEDAFREMLDEKGIPIQNVQKARKPFGGITLKKA